MHPAELATMSNFELGVIQCFAIFEFFVVDFSHWRAHDPDLDRP
tara:strand:- start:61 stop:192 length:132 start_codon:yes stop_codon:yes gene_type:complete